MGRVDRESRQEEREVFWETRELNVKLLFPRIWEASKAAGSADCWDSGVLRCTFSIHRHPSLPSSAFFPLPTASQGILGDRTYSLHGNISHPAPLMFCSLGLETTLRGDRVIQFPISFNSCSFTGDNQQDTN